MSLPSEMTLKIAERKDVCSFK